MPAGMLQRALFLYAAVAFCLTMPAAAGGDFIAYGKVQTIHQETRDAAGVGSFDLQREGGPGSPKEEWVARVEAYGLDGEPIANLEVRWPDASTTDVICVIAESGNSYRFVGYEDATVMRLEFEDYAGGESFGIRSVGDRIGGDRKVYRSQEEADAAIEEIRRRSRLMVEGGGAKSAEELLLQYQGVLAIISMMVYEVETVLGIAPDQRRPASTGPEGPANRIFFCPDGEPFCNFNRRALGVGQVLFGGRTGCCAEASQDADITCQLHTFSGCCANSFCTVTSAICLGYCACLVTGYMWDCAAC